MRQFLFDTLNNLYKLAGLRQIENMMELPDPKKEVNELLDELCKVCGMFSYIPEADMQNIIRDAILSDKEFKSLNARTLFGWFDKVKGIYFARSTEQIKVPEDYKPVTGEARDKYIEQWLAELKKVGQPVKTEFKGTMLKSSLANLSELPETKGYQKPSLEYLESHERHTAWIRANFDPITAKKLPNWIEEKEWIDLTYKD